MSGLKEFAVNEAATSTSFNLVANQNAQNMVFGLRPEYDTLASTLTAYPASPQLVFKVHPLLASRVVARVRFKSSGGATASIKFEMQKGASKDQLFELTTTGGTSTEQSAIAAVTALANCGDCVGEDVQVNVYLKIVSGTITMEGLVLMCGNSILASTYVG